MSVCRRKKTRDLDAHARKPSLPPLVLAVRMRFWRTLPSAPISLQKSVITCARSWGDRGAIVSAVPFSYTADVRGRYLESDRLRGGRARTWECRAMALPRIWLKRFTPMMLRATMTMGAKRPPSFALPATTLSAPR